MIVAVDVGGTKTLIAGFDQTGSLTVERKLPTLHDETAFLRDLTSEINSMFGNMTLTAISIALPGMFSTPGTLDYAPNLGWEHVNIRRQLQAVFDCPIFVENDANLAGLSEARALANPSKVCLYVTISTGIGTGVIVDNQIAPEFSGSEGGHMQLEYDGALRSWESFASGNSIHLTYGKYAYEITSKKAWAEIADKISRGFLALIPMLQPDVIIIGGSIGTHFEKYAQTLERLLDHKLTPSHIAVPPIKQAAHPQKAVVYGCYYYAVDHLSR